MTEYDTNDVYRRLENLKQKECVSDRNAQLLDEFVEELLVNDSTSDSRVVWYISKFSTIFQQYLRKDRFEEDRRIQRSLSTESLDGLTKKDLINVIGVIKDLPMYDLWTERCRTDKGVLTPLQAKEDLSSEALDALGKIDHEGNKYRNYEPAENLVEELRTYSLVEEGETSLELTDFGEEVKEAKEAEFYAEKTVNGFKTAFKMFFKQRHPLEYKRPDRVKKILQSGVLKGNRDAERKTELNLLGPEDVWEMVDCARNPRDALLPILCLDTGARNKELREITLGDIEKGSESWAVKMIDSKNDKDPRELPLTHSLQQLRNWVESHPRKDDPEAPLLVTLSDKGDGKRGSKLAKENINKILKRLAARADVVEEPDTVKVYDFRHSSATFRGTEKDWGVSRMMWWYAWRLPNRAKTYCHENNKRMKDSVLRDKGIKQDGSEPSMQMQECKRCEEQRPPEANYCYVCSLPLDSKAAMEDKNLKEAARVLVEMKLEEKVDDEEVKDRLGEVKKNLPE